MLGAFLCIKKTFTNLLTRYHLRCSLTLDFNGSRCFCLIAVKLNQLTIMNLDPRLKALKWVMFIRHFEYDRVTKLLTKDADVRLNCFARAIKPHLLADWPNVEIAIFHSNELRSFQTASALAWHLYNYIDELPIFGLSCLSKSEYHDGVVQMNTVLDFLPDGAEGAIVTNHNLAIPGIVGAFHHLITGEVIVCDVPNYGEGYIMDVSTGEITIGLKNHFAKLDAEKRATELTARNGYEDSLF